MNLGNKNEFVELETQAATLERLGKIAEAAMGWLRALAYSNSQENRDWCKCRAEYCESRFAREDAARARH